MVALAGATPAPMWAQTSAEPTRLDQIVVTGQGRGERLSQVASMVQVIDQETIANSAALSITDLLAQNGVGFFSEWTPAQTSINIRGGASDGQGRDFRSDVLVLLNGRRAGTANLSKLSLNDVHRIEVIRGPASVIYGSQAVGGVINIITRNGRNTSGSLLTATTGSWRRLDGTASTAGKHGQWDFYLGASAGYRDDYESGSGSVGTMENTNYTRRGGLGAAGYAFNDLHRLDVMARSDGTYRAGFRGSSWDTDNQEDRYNASFDLTYSGGLVGVGSTGRRSSTPSAIRMTSAGAPRSCATPPATRRRATTATTTRAC
jgi:vitamin B12 transporter